MANHYPYTTNIADPINSLTEFVNFHRKKDDILRFMTIQSPQIQNILFTQGHKGGNEDDPIVPPN